MPDVAKIGAGDLRSVNSFADAMALIEKQYGATLDASAELGDGFELLDSESKVTLVGVGCAFVSWSFSAGKYDDEFVACRVVTEHGRKVVVIDGGTGIRAQLREFTDTHGGRQGGLLSRRGLRKSDYEIDVTDPKTGEMSKEPATTFYIDTSA